MKRFLRKGVVPLLVTAVVLGLLDPTLVIVPVKLVWAIGFGWISAGWRLWPGMEKYWADIAIWALGILIAFAGIHWFARSVRKEWPIRYSVALFGVVWLGILASMTLIGVVHQIAWMAASKEPPLTDGRRLRLLVNANQISALARGAEWVETEVRKQIWGYQRPIWEDFNVVFQSDGRGVVTNLLVIDRAAGSGFAVVNASGSKVEPMRMLESRLRGGGF
jgi:hypothetical protein